MGLFNYKLLIFISMLLPLTATAVAGQESSVILPTREISIRTAFNEIEKQTDYTIAVNWANIHPERVILYAASRLSVREMLTQSLAGTGYTWEVHDKQIVITAQKGPIHEPMLYSAIYRNSLPQQRMTVVHDPYSRRYMHPEEIAKIRSGQWRRNGDNGGVDSVSLAVINFRVNRTNIEPYYMGNAWTLDLIHQTFSNRELLYDMDFITITAAASPEGSTENNTRLAADRAMAIKNYIMQRYPFMDRDRIFTFSIGEDWSGLHKMVMDDYFTPYRYEVLQILGTDMDSNTKRHYLKSIGGGAAYRYIADNMLPYLRGGVACMIYYKKDTQPYTVKETIVDRYRVDTVYKHTHSVDTVYIDRHYVPQTVQQPTQQTVYQPVQQPVEVVPAPVVFTMVQYQEREVRERKDSGYSFAIKTNMIYDLLLLPDLAIEFPLPGRWSIEAGGQWSWWNTTEPNHYYHRIQMAGFEGRKWLGDRDKAPLTGHFLGLYAMGGTYDLKAGAGTTGVLSNWSYSMGVTYGYSTPIGKRLNLEFSIGLGYLGGEYKKYKWLDDSQCYHWQETLMRNYFGPTKARVSLVWLIGKGKNSNNAK